MSESNITTTQQPDNSLKKLLNSDNMKRQFAAALPRHLSADRFCRVAITALSRTPALVNCTQESFFKCLLDLSAWGIEPDGRRAHLIPFKRKFKDGNTWREVLDCTLILDWKGLAELAMRSGIIAKLHSDLVCENDDFSYDLGEILHHRINWKAPRGEPYAAYAIAETKDGAKFCQVMTKDEIERIRNNSQGYKSAIQYDKSNPWISDAGEMWKKTVFRRLSKWLPLSPEFRDAAEREDEPDNQLRDVTPDALSPSKPKFLAKAGPEAPTLEAGDDSPSFTDEEPRQQEQPAPAEEVTEADRVKLVDQVNEMRDGAGISMADFKAKVGALGIVDSKAMLNKYPADTLQAIIARWEELKGGQA